jgi:hypothetical protein
MDAVGVPTELMLAAEAVGIVIALRAFQAENFPRLRLPACLEGRRGRRRISSGGVYDGLPGRRRFYRIVRLGRHRIAGRR